MNKTNTAAAIDPLAELPPTLAETALPPSDRAAIGDMGDVAHQLILNPAFRLACANLERDLIGRWRVSGDDPKISTEAQVANRERLFVQMQMLQEIQERLQKLHQEGRLAGGPLRR